MSLAAAETLILALGAYFGLGLIVGLIYMLGGAGRIDPAAKGKDMPLRVRLLILPGIVALWPVMLAKLFVQRTPPVA
ncbi:MAG: hypothetical protein AAGH49_11870 [Pseudomonadota bacterium]